ncbi:globin domain-containing protein [Eisenibacter elegans]|jgi:nitric oxide dioxygenase|uniref:globin domain-containing protein n=1 Tax=Eisenibacter elegans TaxID=997 RepID=UPI000415ABD7|nr:globin domain-containing protein [Eisenibacter elegans]
MDNTILNADEKELIKNSWATLVAKSQQIGLHFYTQLFEQHPEFQPLFKDNTQEQARKLSYIITLVVTKLDKLEHIGEEVKYLGKRHINYQVRPEYFDPFLALLLQSIKEVYPEYWSDELNNAWSKVLHNVGEAMKKVLAGA